jgi:hypothetical protein
LDLVLRSGERAGQNLRQIIMIVGLTPGGGLQERIDETEGQ